VWRWRLGARNGVFSGIQQGERKLFPSKSPARLLHKNAGSVSVASASQTWGAKT
jgi:hypothetical protein